jgi:hypothetical protein
MPGLLYAPDVPSLPIIRARCRTPGPDLTDKPRTNDQEARPPSPAIRPLTFNFW